MKTKKLIYTTLIPFIFICLLTTGCEPETFETPKEETLPLKMEFEKDTVWSMTGEETEIVIVANKEIEVQYSVEQGEIQLKKKTVSDDANDDKKQSDETNDPEKPADEENPTIIKHGDKITLQKGKNTFTVFTDKYQNKGVMLHFIPSEKNTSDKNPNHKIQPLQLRVWTSKPDKKEFKVEIAHDTPDTLFLQYKPVKFQVKILLSPEADTSSSYYTYEYEVIQGDAIVRIGDAAPGGTKLQPEERKGFYADTAITLYATPLTTEPTWIRILVRKDFGITRVEGAILHMDYIKPRGMPGVSVSIYNIGAYTGNETKCKTVINSLDPNPYNCKSPRFWTLEHMAISDKMLRGGCQFSGEQKNEKVPFRIGLSQSGYYVPGQEYRIEIHIWESKFFDSGIIEHSYPDGSTINYDRLLAKGLPWVDIYVNMPPTVHIEGNEINWDSIVRDDMRMEIKVFDAKTNAYIYNSMFDLTFVFMKMCSDV